MDIINALELQQKKEGLPEFKVGDNVAVHYRIVEGNRERIQVFQGDVIARKGSGSRETFTVRKISFAVGCWRPCGMEAVGGLLLAVGGNGVQCSDCL